MTEGPDDDLGFALPRPAVVSRTRALAIGTAIVVIVGAALVFGWLPRRDAQKALQTAVAEQAHAARRVEVVAPKPVASDRALVLPGTIAPLEETTIRPRAD